MVSGERSSPICELELELKKGERAELFKVAHDVAKLAPARLVMRSKADRGYELLDGKEPDATSGHPDTVAGTSSAEAFQRIGRACLRQVADNEHAVRVGDAEGVHQMRVGLRRLRAAISLFSSLLEDRQTSAIKHELKWLTSELGPARELDVFIRHALHPVHRSRSTSNAYCCPAPGFAAGIRSR